MTSSELREKYIQFFESKGHKRIASASLIPENDPTVLFTTAGMHPLVPYLLGAKHPAGTRLTDVQKCVRTGDIDEVGDRSHCTFFEMLGNWSLGDYFKEDSIAWSFEFLTEVLKIDKNRLAVSVFQGDKDAPADERSAKIWESLGISKDRIFYLPKKNNWWGPAGLSGPCGPDTEIFIDTGKEACSKDCSPACDCGKYLEIWNNVFMEYYKDLEGNITPMERKNVDTGMGLERTISVLNNCSSVYETDLFSDAVAFIKEKAGVNETSDENTRYIRIVADHIRTATFLIGDTKGISPSNVDQGYVLRRLIRRAVRFSKQLGIEPINLIELSKIYIQKYKEVYPELKENEERIKSELQMEIERFEKTLTQGLKEFYKLLQYIENNRISGRAAFRLYDTFGFPIEMTEELAKENNVTVDVEGYRKCFTEHQEKSHAGAEQKFKGGLADHSEATTRLHTATHLLHAGLRKVLGEEVAQRGSNITEERLRFDFNFGRPMTDEEIKSVENFVNEAIKAAVDVKLQEMSLEEAKKQGAIGLFESKYGEKVKVYTIEGFSKEICGGPHAKNTAELKGFEIQKEQSSSAGVRRIKAVISAL